MFGTIIVLIALILITPDLLGHPSELTSIPVLIVAMTPNQSTFIVDVTGAVQAYLYRNVTLNVTRINANGSSTGLGSYARNDSYNAALYIPANETPLWVHARLVDQQDNYFEYNVTVSTKNATGSGNPPTMVFKFPDDPGTGTREVVPPADFRWPVPRRGMLP